MPACVLITRPAHDASGWVQTLQDHALDAQALPLMAIGPCNSAAAHQALQAAHRTAGAGGYRAIMFVSGNAVQHFFQKNRPEALAGQALLAPETRAWTPGPGTAKALLSLGLSPERIDGPAADAHQFESETLWQQVHAQIRPGDRVLIVRGDSPGNFYGPGQAAETPAPTAGAGRDWLAARLREAGAQVELLAVYQRQLPIWNAEQRRLAQQAAGRRFLWLFSSSEAVANLQQLLPGQDWSRAQALTTHERIARRATQAGFGLVGLCRPAVQDVIASIKSRA
ncbi:uroporphyrinogen-III synthase [Comamonas composti]|uniref:uroporphyrinogen-III synthase n=1 Tax=Comamonas composti TaxID=408558 RepID=UPI0004112D09|nr:uroporphyrinogen-III synthase [Comamonas composti]